MTKKSWKKVEKKHRFLPNTISTYHFVEKKFITYYIIGFPSALALIDREITTEIGIAKQSVSACPFLSLS